MKINLFVSTFIFSILLTAPVDAGFNLKLPGSNNSQSGTASTQQITQTKLPAQQFREKLAEIVGQKFTVKVRSSSGYDVDTDLKSLVNVLQGQLGQTVEKQKTYYWLAIVDEAKDQCSAIEAAVEGLGTKTYLSFTNCQCSNSRLLDSYYGVKAQKPKFDF